MNTPGWGETQATVGRLELVGIVVCSICIAWTLFEGIQLVRRLRKPRYRRKTHFDVFLFQVYGSLELVAPFLATCLKWSVLGGASATVFTFFQSPTDEKGGNQPKAKGLYWDVKQKKSSRTGLEKYGKEEWTLRLELAAAYRVAAHCGWDYVVYNHISVRIPSQSRSARN
jgi:hypothetical protein